MAKVTIGFGVLLILLSAGAYTMLGQHSHGIHSLIPGLFGLLLVLFGFLAETPVAKKRMLFMHIGVTVGLLGFLGTIPGILGVIQMASGHGVARPEAAKVQAMMGSLCLIYVLLCVRSFVSARRARLA